MFRYVKKTGDAIEVTRSNTRGLSPAGYSMQAPRRPWRVCEQTQVEWPLVAAQQFILATRDTGYRSISAAVNELIDNAFQAHAADVHVFVREERTSATLPAPPRRRVSVAVLDNGSGMNALALRTALQFGGSERFNDRRGAGRFGMGLPNSSISQSRRLEVYSWRDSEAPLFTYIDVDEIAAGTMKEVPAPIVSALPTWVYGALSGRQHLPRSGTLVLWPECDRLPHRKAATVRAKLLEALGRTYRYALRDGKRIFVDNQLVVPVDPLLEWGGAVDRHGSAAQYGEELRYEFKVPTAPHRTSVVRVRFTVLPVRRWANLPLETRRELGIIGGAGVSIVRAGREVDCGWHLMGAKRRENYDDWWRCEVQFEPALDEYFGITHSKQSITPHPVLQEAIAADMERIARTLNVRIRSEFLRNAVRNSLSTTGVQKSPHVLPTVTQRITMVARERERFLPLATQRINRFRITHDSLASPRFFIARLIKGELLLTLNAEHPLYQAMRNADAASCELLITMLLAAARAEVSAPFQSGALQPAPTRTVDAPQEPLVHFLEAWSDVLAAYVSRHA